MQEVMSDHTYELIIIGGGPAGLAAGLYAARDELDCLLFERGAIGGQVILSNEIANYPGFLDLHSGLDLAKRLSDHALHFGLRVQSQAVDSITSSGGIISVGAAEARHNAKSVIIATGSSYRKLGIPGEDRLQGSGVSYCGSCDGPFFRDKSVVVIGGGDASVEEAIFLSRFASEVKLVHRRDKLRAGPALQKLALENKKIKFIWNSIPREIRGDKMVEGVLIENVRDGRKEEVRCGGVFILVGTKPNSDFLRGFVKLDDNGYVITDINMRTSVGGVFAAGDVRKDSVRQIASSVGDGVTALIQAERYIGTLD